MQPGDGGWARRERVLGYLSGALLVYGAAGVALLMRLPAMLWEGARGWLGPPGTGDAPVTLSWLDPIQAHYDALPWLPWAAWLGGLAIVAWLSSRRSAADRFLGNSRWLSPGQSRRGPLLGRRWISVRLPLRWRWTAALLVLLALLLLGGYARLSVLLPPDVGVSQLPYDDEGVNAGASQLFVQGVMPYRDYFFAHPPLAAATYAPAMLYRFNEWGSPTSFMNARYLSVAYGLVTLALLFSIGLRLAGVLGGTVAGLLWALDGRVVEINRKVMLDTPMVMFACAALALYVWARPGGRNTKRLSAAASRWAMLGVGVFAALATLTKITGVAILLAIAADLVWTGLEARRRQPALLGEADPSPDAATPPPPAHSTWPQLLSLLGGALATVALVAGPFLLLAPSQVARQVFFFQLLRPGDGIADVPARVADLTSTLSNALTPLFAALGFLALTLWVWRRREMGDSPWRVVVLWTFFSLFLFTYSRSFYPHYYIQLAAPLCLLGAGVLMVRKRAAHTSWVDAIMQQAASSPDPSSPQPAPRQIVRPSLLVPIALGLLALPLVATMWGGIVTRREDRIFEIVARYVNNAVPPGASVLSTDQQFNLLAARPPSRNATGYLVDSYGHMIYLGMGLDARDWNSLLADLFGGPRSNDAYEAMLRPAPQADIADRAARAPLIVVHDRGFARLSTETLRQIETLAAKEIEEARYTIYRNLGGER